MKISKIIDQVSDLYRTELLRHRNLCGEYTEVVKKLSQADNDGGKHITYNEYQCLKARKIALQQEVNDAEKYCDGISAVRELLMDSI